MKKYVLVFTLIAIVVCFPLLVFSQVKPSFYAGWGTCTNLGGVLGFGTEVKYKLLSLNAAVGVGHGLESGIIFTERKYGVDIGVKIYSKNNFFGGINYGYITTREIDDEIPGWFTFSFKTKEYYGFSISAGYRVTIYKHLYGMGYLGVASDYLTFMPEKERERVFIPRFGLIIGYEF